MTREMRLDAIDEYDIVEFIGCVDGEEGRRCSAYFHCRDIAPHEMSFFDGCDFCQQIIDGKHCWDMYGWVVPNELVHKFEPVWIENDNVELEKYYYVCASWEDRNGQPYAVVDGNLSEEAYA